MTTLIVVVTTAFVTSFSSSAMNLAIPAIGIEFDASATFTGWIVTGYMLCVAMFAVPFGRLADLTGRRRIFLIGIVSFSVLTGLTFFAWNIETVVILRVLQGLACALIFATNNAILIDSYPVSIRGKMLGFAVTSTYFGLSTGPVFGGLITHYLGWRYVFIFTLLISLFAMILALAKLPKNSFDHEEKTKGSFNIFGNILYLGMIFCIMYGFSSFGENHFAKMLIFVGVGLLVLFVIHELKTEKPIIKMSLFIGNTSFLLSNLAALFNYGATFAVGYLMSIYLQLIMGLDAQWAGIVLITQPLIMAIISPFAGKASDKVSPFKMASFGMALCAITLFSYTFLGVNGSIIHILINLIIIGIGFGVFSSPNTNAIMSCVEKEDYGVASSILATMRSLGHTSSMAIITLIMSTHLGKLSFAQATPEQLVGTMHTCFIVFSIICVVGVFISLQRKTKHLENDRKS